MWNGLPSDVTSASSLSVFKNRLKTYLFRRCYETVDSELHFFFLVIISLQNSGRCNSSHCLGHFKNVCDDDDDGGDDDAVPAVQQSINISHPPGARQQNRRTRMGQAEGNRAVS